MHAAKRRRTRGRRAMRRQQRTHAPIAKNPVLPHPVNPDKCMWNKKYKGYRFKYICNKLEVTFKPPHSFTAEMGGYAKTEDAESE